MISFQLSYSHRFIRIFLEPFCFLLEWVRLLDTLIAIPQHSVYFEGICKEELVDGTSFILTIILFLVQLQKGIGVA